MVVEGAVAHVSLRCQTLSLLEVIENLDADGDGAVDPAELAARQADIVHYVGEHYVLRSGTDRDMQGGARLRLQGAQLRQGASSESAGPGFRAGAVDLELDFAADEPIGDLLLDVTLFHSTSPDHIDLASVVWPDGSQQTFGLTLRGPRARADFDGKGLFVAFLELGTRHILAGWDHLAFLAALVLGSSGLRRLFVGVTAFTLAHSVTLALAATGTVNAMRHAALVEMTIALSIAYVAAENLLTQPGRSRWQEVFLIGLVHGFGFAGFLSASLVDERQRLPALAAFNLGIEAGQLAVVGALALALTLLPREQVEEGPRPLAPESVRRGGSLVLVVLGLYWFVQRVQ